MTKKERAAVLEVIRLLHTDDGFEPAMRILMPMVGLTKPIWAAIDAATESVRVSDLFKESGRK